MNATIDHTDEEEGEHDFVVCNRRTEEGSPVPTRVSRFCVLRPSHHCRKDEERDQSNVDNGGKEHIAS